MHDVYTKVLGQNSTFYSIWGAMTDISFTRAKAVFGNDWMAEFQQNKDPAELAPYSGDICPASEEVNGAWYNGIRLYDENEALIIDESWHNFGEWTALEHGWIPGDEIIIGLRCDATSYYSYIYHLSLILAKENKAEIVNELRFPPMNTYPSYEVFKPLYLTQEY